MTSSLSLESNSNSDPLNEAPLNEPLLTQLQLNRIQWFQIIFINLFILFISELLEQSLNQTMLRAMRGESGLFFLIAGSLFFHGLFFMWLQSVALLSVIYVSHKEVHQRGLLEKWGDFTREWLRSMGDASLWCFVLLVPGLLRWLDYSLLPFVCFLDPQYTEGRVDALRRCRKIAKAVRGRLFLILVFFGMVLPLLESLIWSDYESFAHYPGKASTIILWKALVSSLSCWILWRLFLKARLKS